MEAACVEILNFFEKGCGKIYNFHIEQTTHSRFRFGGSLIPIPASFETSVIACNTHPKSFNDSRQLQRLKFR